MAMPILPLAPTPEGWTPFSDRVMEGMMEEGIASIEIRSQFSWTVQPREVETCGLAFFQYLRNVQGEKEGGGSGAGGKRKDRAMEDEEEEDEDDENTFRFPKKALTEDDIEDMDYYTLLGLGHLAMRADQELIKKAYRKALLLYHPDKTGRGDRDEVFIQVQKAYETLSDERKKRAYDSELDFDESIPTGRERGDFFNIYAPVFQRNARFAAKRPVPQLGDKDSSIDDVYSFYDYWTRFESWRDFSLKAAEHNLEEAGSREEKRWMQKENDKRARAMKRDEYKRLATLVERAKTLDPRLANAKEADKKRKEQLKLQREEEKRKKEEEAKRIAEEEKKKQEAEEARLKEERAQAKAIKEVAKKRAKAIKEVAKKRMRTARSRFRAQCKMMREKGGKSIIPEDEEFLCEVLEVERIEEAVKALGGEGDINQKGIDTVLGVIANERSLKEAKAQEEEAEKKAAMDKQVAQQQAAAQAIAAKDRPWTEDELATLAKAVIRFPAGTQKRWQCIADFINHMLRLKDLRTKEECIKQYQVVQAAPQKSAVDQKTVSGVAGGSTTTPGPSLSTSVGAGLTSPATSSGLDGSVGGGGGGGRVVKVEAASEEDVWSQEQQKQLEGGLVKHPASMEKNERWKAIAEGVDGKSKKQCIERYKALRAAIQQQKKK